MKFTPGSLFRKARAYGCYWMGIVQHYRGNARDDVVAYDRAVLWYQRALDLDPSLAQARLDQGIIYWRELDHPRRAVIEFSRLLVRGTKQEATLFNRAVAYQQLGDYEHALADFRAYLKIGQHSHHREYAEKMLMEFSDAGGKGR